MAQANVKLTVDASGATRALQGVQNKTTKLQSAFGGLRTAIAGIGIGLIARNAVKAATDFEKLNQRLKILTTENGTYAESLKLAEQAQTKFGLSSIDALEGVTNLQARLGPLGSTMDEITAIFNGFNTAAILSGASAQEQAGAMRQLTQALGSGVLRGDEFNSISEQMSAVLKPIANQLGVNVGELRKFAAEGKITKDVVVAAFKEIEKQGASALKELIKNDPTMVFKVLSNETEKLSIAVGNLLAPAVLDAVSALTKLISSAQQFASSPIVQTAAIFTGVALAIKGVTVAVALLKTALTIAATQLSLVGTQALIASGGFKGMAATSLLASGGIGKLTLALGALKLATLATGFGAVAIAIGAITTAVVKHIDKQKEYNKLVEEGGNKELEAAIKALKAQKARLEAQKRGTAFKQERLDSLNEEIAKLEKALKTVIKENAVEKEKKKLKKENEEIEKEINKLIKDNLKKTIAYEQAEIDAVKAKGKLIDQLSDQKVLAQAAVDGNLKQVQIQQEINALVAIHGEGMRDVITKYIEGTEALKKQKTEADELKNKFDEIGEAIESSIKDNLRDAITGAQSFGQAMTNVLNRIRDKIIDAQLDRLVGGISDSFSNAARGGTRRGLGGLLGGILGGLLGGKKERGGPVSAGGAYVVGERGPEILQMGSKGGNIIPNSQIGGGGGTTNVVTVNVDASGSSVSGNNAEASQLGQVIGAAVQAQLIKEKRAGGLLTR